MYHGKCFCSYGHWLSGGASNGSSYSLDILTINILRILSLLAGKLWFRLNKISLFVRVGKRCADRDEAR